LGGSLGVALDGSDSRLDFLGLLDLLDLLDFLSLLSLLDLLFLLKVLIILNVDLQVDSSELVREGGETSSTELV
jgi:hypothetical protein